jgi:hypothetical protein
MARTADATKTKERAIIKRGRGRLPQAPPVTPAKTTRAVARAPIAATAAPKISKDELRASVEKLERANASLRIKNRDANRAAKLNAARITELEEQVVKLEKQAARAGARSGLKPTKVTRVKRRSPEAGSGDAVSADVNVHRSADLDEEPATPAPEQVEELQEVE